MNNNKNKRINWIDIARGILMLFVIESHLECCPPIYKTIFGPVFLSGFFFISGYLFSEKTNFKEYFINKTKTLLLPFGILGLINILLRFVISFNKQKPILVQFKEFVFQIGETSGLWFIACLYITSIIFYFINKLLKNNKKKIYFTVITVCGIISFLYNKYIQIELPWHIQKVGIAVFFMAIGLIYKNFIEERIRKYENKINLFFLILVYSFLLYLNYKIFNNAYISINSYDTEMLMYFILSLVSIWILVIVSKEISSNKWIEFVGKNTLVYFAFSGKIQSVLEVILKKYIIYNASNIYYISVILTIIISILLGIPSIIINRYFPFILGKKKQKNIE